MKILIWLVIVLAVVVWVKRALAGATRTAGQADAARRPPSETIVQCAHCGVHFPVSEAVAGIGDAVYCCAEHRKLG